MLTNVVRHGWSVEERISNDLEHPTNSKKVGHANHVSWIAKKKNYSLYDTSPPYIQHNWTPALYKTKCQQKTRKIPHANLCVCVWGGVGVGARLRMSYLSCSNSRALDNKSPPIPQC